MHAPTALRLALLLSPLITGTATAASHGGHAAAAGGATLAQCQDAAALPSPHCGRAPSPAFDAQGRLWLAFVQGGHVYVTYGADGENTFAPAVAINPQAESIYSDGENRPKIAFTPTGTLVVSWTQKIAGAYAGDIRFARSSDGGGRFEAPITVNDDRAPISHRFDSLIVDGAGRITLTWIDKRDLALAKQSGTDYAGAAIYTATSHNDGASFAPNQKLADHSCECCRIALATDGERPPLALWRHVFPVNQRDHAIARLDPATLPVAEPMRATHDGWVIEGCPHHGPDLSVDTGGQAHMVWFAGGGKAPGLHYGRIDPATGKRSAAHRLSHQPGASRPQVRALGNGRVFVAWKALQPNGTVLLISESKDGGQHWSPERTLASTAGGSDHPQMIVRQGELFLSWQTQADGYRLIPVPAP
ncbi:MAG: exo-alpha-sialidase [Denitromonas halophila]|nr:MAG: exo-alpha-sialidase [Denitromonas halophila]